MLNNERMRVVVIDDDEFARTVLRLAMPVDVCEVVGEAGSGRSGLELCMKVKPDIIMLDVSMPEMDGLMVLAAVKDAMPAVEVLMVTGNNDRSTIVDAINGGASGYIVKPLTGAKIENALKRPIANVRSRRATLSVG